MTHHALTAMPHGLPGGLDLWHLGLFPVALFWPCVAAYFIGCWIAKSDQHPPIGWLCVAGFVAAAVFTDLLTALLLASDASMFLAVGWAGVHVTRRRLRHEP